MLLCAVLSGAAQGFEDASTAVANMRIGWNAGNRLDANSGDVNNMWIEAWSERMPKNYETAWGQPQITRELIHMFKEAGFNAIRVPVTWYPHMGSVIVDPAQTDRKPVWDNSTWTGFGVDPVWMARVREVVDYVVGEGMYCILNIHHDTGDATTAWLRADMTVYETQKERFEALWTQIAEEFRDYDGHLLFEGYNEMLDSYGSWCFASFNTSSRYDEAVAKSAYDAINSYAQSFVNAVRATGGNNTERNLVVCTYGACCGDGTWNSHLQDPLKEMKIPHDNADGHIILEVHAYPALSNASQATSVVNTLVATWKTHLLSKGAPLIIGEWGTGNEQSAAYRSALAEALVKRCKEENIATFLWMAAADGEDCKVPQWTDTELKDAIVKGYYGEGGYSAINAPSAVATSSKDVLYNLKGQRIVAPMPSEVVVRNGRLWK